MKQLIEGDIYHTLLLFICKNNDINMNIRKERKYETEIKRQCCR
jgi:hypothetical protein